MQARAEMGGIGSGVVGRETNIRRRGEMDSRVRKLYRIRSRKEEIPDVRFEKGAGCEVSWVVSEARWALACSSGWRVWLRASGVGVKGGA